jgi:hypothetical protein
MSDYSEPLLWGICRRRTNRGALVGRRIRVAPGCGSGFKNAPRGHPDAAIVPDRRSRKHTAPFRGTSAVLPGSSPVTERLLTSQPWFARQPKRPSVCPARRKPAAQPNPPSGPGCSGTTMITVASRRNLARGYASRRSTRPGRRRGYGSPGRRLDGHPRPRCRPELLGQEQERFQGDK